MSVLTVPLCIFSCLAQAGPSKESIQKYEHLGLNNINNNNNNNNTCNKVAKAVKQCSIHYLSVEL